MAERQPALVTPFWVRIAAETSLSPGWLLIAFPAVLYPTYLLLEALFGRGLIAATDFAGDPETWMVSGWAIGLGYASMMSTYVARGTYRDLEDLRPVLRGGEATYADLRQRLTWFERRRLWIGAFIGLALFILNSEYAINRWTRLLAGDWSIRATCIVATGFAAWMVFWRAAVYLVDSARVYSRMGEQHVVVDLLDLGPLSPLTRHGLRIVLLLTIYAALWATYAALWATEPLWWPEPFAPKSLTMVVIIPLACTVAVATLVFLFPVRGLRRQIRARKAEQLAKIREDIRSDQDLVAQRGAESAEASTRLPGLITLEKRIESVREWPFDAPTLTRFFLYVAIPLGSWVGGALVERLLGAALD